MAAPGGSRNSLEDTMKRRRYLSWVVGLAALHMVMSFGSLAIGVGIGMKRLGTGGGAGLLETMANRLAEVLFRPGSHLWVPGMSGSLDWAIIVGNSVLWGVVGASVIVIVGAARKSKQTGS